MAIAVDESLQLELSSMDGRTFTGFMTMAFDRNSNSGPIGTFTPAEHAKTLSCAHGLPVDSLEIDSLNSLINKLIRFLERSDSFQQI